MIAAVVNGNAAWIVPFSPNTDDVVRLGAKVPVDLVRGLTGRSSRRPQDLSMRLSLEWTASIKATAYAALRNATLLAQDEPILVPAWPFACAAAATPAVTSGLTIAWNPGWECGLGTWAVNPESLADYAFQAPLLYGRMSQPPRLAGKNGELVIADFSFIEDGPVSYTLTPPAAADTTVETASGFAATVFAFIPEVSTLPKVASAVTAVERKVIGPGRMQASAFYPQTPERVFQASFKFTTAAAAAQLLGWWSRRVGITDPHWVAESQMLAPLSADVAPGAAILDFARPPTPIGANTYLGIYDSSAIEIVRTTGLAGSTAPLVAGTVNGWSALTTIVSLAFLARHTNEELVIEFRRANTDWLATSTLAWREVSQEYVPPGDETQGTTIGRLPGKWFGFQIKLDYNGALQNWYLTNYASGGMAVGGLNWVYNACSFDKLVQSIDLSNDSCTFSARYFTGGPWDNWLPGNLSATGILTIFRADVAVDGTFSNYRMVWTGELSTPTRTGPMISHKVLGANALFDRRAPRQLMAIPCGTNLLSSRCGQLLTDWTFNAVVTAGTGTNTITVNTITRANGNPLPAGFGFANWFFLGWVGWMALDVITGLTTLTMRAGVLSCTALDGGGNITLQLDRACPLVIGSAVPIAAGCDRLPGTCQAYDAVNNPTGKFDNYTNFRGFPFMPAIAPEFVIPQQNTSPAKK